MESMCLLVWAEGGGAEHFLSCWTIYAWQSEPKHQLFRGINLRERERHLNLCYSNVFFQVCALEQTASPTLSYLL